MTRKRAAKKEHPPASSRKRREPFDIAPILEEVIEELKREPPPERLRVLAEQLERALARQRAQG